MAATWDMSFLVDQTTQIQEARGNLGRHFGILQQVLIGKHLVNFVDNEDRLALLRMMGKLQQRNWNEIVAIRVHTPMSGERRVAMQARPGSGPRAWWLMLAESGADIVPLIGDVESSDPMATEEEFGTLAGKIAAEAPTGVDLSVFRADALADPSPQSPLSAIAGAELDERIGEALMEDAAGKIVARPSLGQYALMHGKQVGPDRIALRIVATAEKAGISAEALGLSHDTQPLAADSDPATVRNLIRTMRSNLAQEDTATGVAFGARKASLFDRLMGMVGKA